MAFHERAVEADRSAREETKKMLLKHYPYIDLNQFKILTHIDGDAKAHPEVVFMDKHSGREIDVRMDKLNQAGRAALVALKPKPAFPTIWMAGGDIQPLLRQYPVGSAHDYNHWPPVVLDYPINNFKVYVNEKDYFMSGLPPLKRDETLPTTSEWSDDESYYRILLATYTASYSCGISMQHLTESDAVDKRITSLMRFHLYFTVQRLLRRAEAGETLETLSAKYNGSALHGKTDLVHRRSYYKNHRLSDGTLGESIVWQVGDVANDYRRYVPRSSNGLTAEVGSRLLNDSIAAYVYAVLGAQAKMRASIVNQGAISLQCQDVFRQIVRDSIVSNDVVSTVSNMRKAVSDCNQVLNLAVSPDTFLLPSNMTILKRRIAGYSNVLYRASEENMKFGVNNDVNTTAAANTVAVRRHPNAPL